MGAMAPRNINGAGNVDRWQVDSSTIDRREESDGIERAGDSLLPPSNEVDRMSESGDMTAVLVALMTKMAREDRQASQRNELAAAEASWQAIDRKVQALHDKADHMRTEGWVEGGAMMVEGAASMGSAATSRDATKAILKGVGEGASGAGKVGGGNERAAQSLDDARVATADAAKDAADRFLKIHGDSAADAREHMRKISEWYSEMKRTKESTVQAAFHRA